jgi:AP2-associated kinase
LFTWSINCKFEDNLTVSENENCLSFQTRLNEQRTNGISLNERQILRIFADICTGVSACHYRRPQPILHRDIKLENILIDSHQAFLLCDFGSAIMLPPSTTNEYQQYQFNQLTTTVIQQLEEEIQRYTTLSYRAPEMIDLYSRLPITLKADIWAMGCLLYKLMYNIMPFGDSILAIQNGTFVIPDDMAQVYSRELNIFVRYMLEIDINKRPDIWQV